MKRFFKEKCTVLVGLMMAISSQANAVDYDRSAYCEPPSCESKCGEIYVIGELLYWRPELCGLEGAFGDTTIATNVNQDAITITTVTESDKEPKSKWNAGFRVGVGTSYDCFDLELKWTHFDGHAKFSDHAQHGKWNIHYDVVDLTFGRNFAVSPCFYVKPFIGVRGAKIRQKLKSHLQTLFTSSLIGDNTVLTDKNDSEDFKGIGPEIGFDANWYLGCNFSLYGSFAVVGYYGDVKSKNYDTDTFTQTVSICNGKRKHCFNNLGTDAALGIRWDTATSCFCGCEVNLMLKLGLEQHRIYDFSELGSDGNLSLDGGVFAAGLNFNY